MPKPEQQLRITGGKRLTKGEISIAGSSNQVTKAIIAALTTDEPVLIKGAPDVDERRIVENLFQYLGGTVKIHDTDVVEVCAKGIDKWAIPEDLCRKNRIAVLCAGPLLQRFGKVSFFGALGGDKIGKRPVNFHIDGLAQMGAHVEQVGNQYHLSVAEKGLHGAHIKMPFPSVMTTESLLISAALARGRTVIENSAIEPEIIELCKMLQKMGADITQTPNRTFIIEGV